MFGFQFIFSCQNKVHIESRNMYSYVSRLGLDHCCKELLPKLLGWDPKHAAGQVLVGDPSKTQS